MEYGKFIISGEDKKMLSSVKNALVSNGHLFIGYLKDPVDILKHVRRHEPDMVILELCGRFRDMKSSLEVIDEEMLAACVLIVDSRNDEIFDFLKQSRVLSSKSQL